MKKNITTVVFSLISFIMLLSSCEGTWIMYDTTQKDHLYMENLPSASTVSFALVEDLELTHNVKVKMMGMPVNADRQFTVEFLEPSVASVASGESTIDVYKAVAGTDFEAPSFVMPAGAVETTLSFKLKRTETIKDKFASIRFRIVEDAEFVPMVQDSTDLDAIVSSEYEVLFNDGDPVCPVWWSAGAGYEGWQMLIGKFYVAKYRKFLDLFHEMEVSNPVIFEQMVEKYGYNLDNPDMEIAFYQKTDPAVWATYVLIPLYNYFKALYEANPEHPDATIDTFASSGTAGTYWKDPVGQLK
jgi:hypothetical protein